MIKLDAVTYDTLHLASLAIGGIGSGTDFGFTKELGSCPVCAHGLLIDSVGSVLSRDVALSVRLSDAGIGRVANDVAVNRILGRKAKAKGVVHRFSEYKRVSFKEWCRELKVERGDIRQEDM